MVLKLSSGQVPNGRVRGEQDVRVEAEIHYRGLSAPFPQSKQLPKQDQCQWDREEMEEEPQVMTCFVLT